MTKWLSIFPTEIPAFAAAQYQSGHNLAFVKAAWRAWRTAIVLAGCAGAALLLAAAARGAPADFPEYEELQRDVGFWLRVYTEISTEQGFLHDEQNLAVVYDTIVVPSALTGQARQNRIDDARDGNVARLRALAARWRTAAAAHERRSLRQRRGLAPASAREALATLGFDPAALDRTTDVDLGGVSAPRALPPGFELNSWERRVVEMFGVEVSPERIAEAAARVRFQLGQADRFRAGLVRSGTWEGHIARTFAARGLPAELAALPHVESSFNPAAYSKVGAAGLWQFMRSTGRLYMRIDDEVDERLDPFRATEAAAQLLAYNHRLLGAWPLAITAYNHGAAGMRRARDAMGTTNMAIIARNYQARTFGFASRNFYPSFLAVLRIERDPQRYFPGVQRAAEQQVVSIELPAWMPVTAIEAATQTDRATLKAFNPALRDPVWSGARLLPRGYRLHLPRAEQGEPWTLERLLAALPADQLFAAQVRSREHVVRRGESLTRIASRYGVARRDLAALNGLATDASLRRGTVLRLPEFQPPRWENPVSAAAVASVANAVASAADAGEPEEKVAAVSMEPLDARRYGVGEDGTTRLLGGESLPLLAEWLALDVERLRGLNPAMSDAAALGARVRLDFTSIARDAFQKRRQDWHLAQQEEYFSTRRIVGSRPYYVLPEDSLAVLIEKFAGIPDWLIAQYNPQVDIFDLLPGLRLEVPRVE